MSQDLHDTGSTATASTIGEDLTITGDVTSTGTLVVDGRVQGDVRCLSLVLGETSQIEGNVNAEEVVIRGRLIGSVRGQRVMLQANAHVEGDLFHNDLAMEQGAYFEGGSRHFEEPLTAQTSHEDMVSAPEPQQERTKGTANRPSATFVRSLEEPVNV
jgi:cytoskeletal protein CcmA (bactofilin family)